MKQKVRNTQQYLIRRKREAHHQVNTIILTTNSVFVLANLCFGGLAGL